MISFLAGKIQNKGRGYIILRTNDIGYKVFVNSVMFSDLSIGGVAELYTYQYVKEDALDLYGFRSMDELEMFELLISISGIGPKSALGVLTIASVGDIKETIAQGDPSLLIKVSGIGKKTAERVVLELRDKVADLFHLDKQAGGSGLSASGDEIDALMALGYTMQQARDALKQVNPEIKESGQRIKEALKKIGK
jgi:holliday junction DNA helicase RuvA